MASLAERLGLSEDQTWRLVDALRDVLQPHLRRGQYNRIEVSADALAVLERARDLKSRGIPYAELRDEISSEMNGNATESVNRDHREPPTERRETSCEACEARERVIDVLEDRIAELQGRVADLKAERDEFRQLALPNPDRRPWWTRLLSPRGES